MCRWVSLLKPETIQSAGFSVQSINNDGAVIRISTPGFLAENRSAVSMEFSSIQIPGTDLSVNEGFPQLPVITRLIEVPLFNNIFIKNVEIKDVNFKMEDIGLSKPVVPALKDRPVGSTGSSSPDMILDIYKADEFYPAGPVKLVQGGISRGKKLYRLEVYPVLYQPVKRELRLLSNITVTIKISDAGVNIPGNPGRLSSLPIDRTNGGTIISFPGTHAEAGNDNRQPGYLIITPDEFVNPLKPLSDWKRQKGYKVNIVSTTETGADTTGIRNYIRNAYDTWENPPTFILLAGDPSFIPGFRGRFSLNPHVRHITDLYYATMDGKDDIFPDIFVGRFPAADTSELRIMVGKTLFYEKLYSADPDWLDYATFIATQDEDFHELVEQGHRASIHDFFAPNDIASDSIWTFYNASGEQLTRAINRGTAAVTYSGHGSETYWNDLDGADPHGYSLFDLYYLENKNRYPAVLSFGCNAGDFSRPECLGKSWLRFENRGAALFWGATDLAFWNHDYYLQQKLFAAGFEKEYDTFSQMAADALLQVFTQGYQYYDIYFEIYNLLGDPAAPFWAGKPDSLFVVCPDTLVPDAGNLSVTVNNSSGPVDNALAAVTQNDITLGVTRTQNGMALVEFEHPVTLTGDVQLTVSKAKHFVFCKNIKLPAMPLVSFTPESLSVNVEQKVQIRVEQPQGVPVPGYLISIQGFGLNSPLSGETDNQGIAEFNIDCPYGQMLSISVQEKVTPDKIYVYGLPVKSGLYFTDVKVSVDSGPVRTDSLLVPGVAGTVKIVSSPVADKIYVRGAGIDTVFTVQSFSILPLEIGEITITLAKNGYQIIQSSLFAVDTRGSITGKIVDNEGSAVPDADVRFISVFSQKMSETKSDGSGTFHFKNIPAGHYNVQIQKQGFQQQTVNVIVVQGDNNKDFVLNKNPLRFELKQNYPNPFNSETKIIFLLPEQSRVKLEIYNTLGQKVTTLVNEIKEPGPYTVRWDGQNEKGLNVSAGVYIMYLKADNQSAIKKMLLLR
ncbi:carboxypeptidase regulatory-like domain-containing protein [candidate division KSB1 bacterium]|nr:carboxypeptidase regulatory-like domain-containing protein [candidate division KSB1 bacterium]